ncbi:glycine cleavage system protein T [Marinobacter salinus]|uniref:Glycine cleavage system protein T n=1 Tax=Marinobacter salinus TaxID=1874317 RepID=A0A1D9GLL6_9GAMM|nr:folate-binding protein YgfZ [Marinobacter salinus]AOY88532.1 glycine cleavage system protein T [Marinobacter salinus]
MTDTDKPVSAASKLAHSPLPDSAWAALTNRTLVRISGPGTDKFLQGQFSQHLEEVVTGYSPRAAAATPKGRAYCLTRMVRDGDDILMDLDSELAESVLNHLRKFLMLFRGTSAKTLTDARVFGLLGSRPAEALAGQPLSGLEKPGDTQKLADGFLICVEPTAEGLLRFEFWQTGGAELRLDGINQVSLADWHAAEIAAGVASLTEATREAFVPQMLNWQHVGGLHFKKGCYTGQEVIARMHFLGQLKKSLFRLRLEHAGHPPAPGASILAGDRSVGTVVNSIQFQDGACELLAVIRHDAAQATLTIEGSTEEPLSQQPLPYPVPEREKTPQTDT